MIVFKLIIVGSLFLVLYTYIIYPLLLLAFPTRRRFIQPSGIESDGVPSISVVIPAFNEERVIERKIQNTLSLIYPKEKLEIWIASDGSTDKTDEICLRYGSQINFFRIDPRQGKANALNEIVSRVKGELLLFTDANTIVESNALQLMASAMGHNEVGAVCGRLVLRPESKGISRIEAAYWRYETEMKYNEGRLRTTIASNGGLYLMRKALYRAIPTDTIIDDFWISMDILEQRHDIVFMKEALGYESISKLTVDEFWRKVRIGSGCLQVFCRRPVLRNAGRFVNLVYYSHKVIRWFIPLLFVFFYLSLVLLCNKTGYGLLFIITNGILLSALTALILDENAGYLSYIGYTMLFNFSLLYGYYLYAVGRQNVLWRKAIR